LPIGGGLAGAVLRAPAAGATEEPKPTATRPEKGIEPHADRLLRQMTDYLAGLQTFQVMSSSVDEVVTTDGRKLQLTADDRVFVARPNRLRSEQIAAPNGMSFWNDGKTMTLYCRADNTYATAPAPPSLDATIDTLRREHQIEAPGADLLFSRPYDVLTEQVTGGQLIGKESVDGVLANHLAFQGDEVDWQVWIQDGPQPLPLRYVITTKGMKEMPQFSVRLSQWQPGAKLGDAVFQFQPPPGAKKVAAFPTSCGGVPK
jgi:hypothetical protein